MTSKKWNGSRRHYVSKEVPAIRLTPTMIDGRTPVYQSRDSVRNASPSPKNHIYFLVTSPGYTASKWLAWALNSLPKVYCSHSAGWDTLDRDYTLAELEQLVHEKSRQRDHEPLDAYFDRLSARAGDAEVLGNVHRYTQTSLRRNVAGWPCSTDVRSINLIRHPVTWVESGSAQMARMADGVEIIRQRLATHFDAHARTYLALGIPDRCCWSDCAFCYMCGRMPQLVAEAQTPEVMHYRMEDMTRCPHVLARLLRQLTGLSASASGHDATRILAHGPIHRHRPIFDCSVAEQWNLWPKWKRHVFDYWNERSGISAAYIHFGYRLDGTDPAVAGHPATSRQISGTSG